MQTKLSYGYGSFGKDFSLALVNVFLFFYLTDVAGMSAATVGIIFVFGILSTILFGATLLLRPILAGANISHGS